jgi:predicted transposase YdaD
MKPGKGGRYYAVSATLPETSQPEPITLLHHPAPTIRKINKWCTFYKYSIGLILNFVFNTAAMARKKPFKPSKEEDPAAHKPYDKIFKENVGTIFLTLAEKHLGVRVKATGELKDKVQVTVEKEADFLCEIISETGNGFILHLEFQAANETDMVYRMQEYYGILRKKYNMPVKQMVYYLGEPPSKMRTQLEPSEIFTGFDLISFRDVPYEQYLTTTTPEEVILALLGNFGTEGQQGAVRKILTRMLQLNLTPIVLEKYLRQMLLLSRLRRGLNDVLQKQIADMPLTYDIEKDSLYLKGREKGREEGMEKGREEGMEKGREEGDHLRSIKTAENCLRKGLKPEVTAEISELPLSEVLEIARRLGLL